MIRGCIFVVTFCFHLQGVSVSPESRYQISQCQATEGSRLHRHFSNLRTRGNMGIQFFIVIYGARCWWRSWLSHCATSQKVAGFIPDGVIGIFHWHNSSGHTMDLGLTQSLTEMSTRNISWGKMRSVRWADNLTTFMCRLSWNLGASVSWKPQGLSRPVMGLLYLYVVIYMCLDILAVRSADLCL
jgi:hypothetical protein